VYTWSSIKIYFYTSSACNGGEGRHPPKQSFPQTTTYQSTLWPSSLGIQDKLNIAFSMLPFPVCYCTCNVSVTVFFLYLVQEYATPTDSDKCNRGYGKPHSKFATDYSLHQSHIIRHGFSRI
jgi:hypothetical protein